MVFLIAFSCDLCDRFGLVAHKKHVVSSGCSIPTIKDEPPPIRRPVMPTSVDVRFDQSPLFLAIGSDCINALPARLVGLIGDEIVFRIPTRRTGMISRIFAKRIIRRISSQFSPVGAVGVHDIEFLDLSSVSAVLFVDIDYAFAVGRKTRVAKSRCRLIGYLPKMPAGGVDDKELKPNP